jgi:hypothetical protein
MAHNVAGTPEERMKSSGLRKLSALLERLRAQSSTGPHGDQPLVPKIPIGLVVLP